MISPLTLLDLSLRAVALGLCVGLILALARIRSGAVRHAAWTAVLFAMLLLPVFPNLTPALPAGVKVPTLAAEPRAEPIFAPPLVVPLAQPAAPGAPSTVPHSLPARVERTALWPAAAWAIYGMGVALLLLRDALGWRAARRIRLGSEAISSPVPGLRVFQSDDISAPVIVGVWRPRILLPRGWSEWQPAKLRAVLAHEGAHVRRYDPVISMIARVNRCVFWVHPLAWWLERRLAVTAEQACDDAGARAVGDGRVYAEALLEVAEAVRHNGGRLAPMGIGMDGRGALEQRIDRILRGDFAWRASRLRLASIAVACLACVLTVAGCRQQSDASLVAQVEKRESDWKKTSAVFSAQSQAARALTIEVRAMTPEQAAAMEDAVRKNPDDYDAHKKLLLLYTLPRNGLTEAEKREAKTRLAAAAWPHGFWMIEHHPEDPIFSGVGIGGFGADGDPAHLSRASALWKEQADREGRPAAVYAHAFRFFRYIDPPLAEQMLVRLQPLDPTGETFDYVDSGWPARFGRFYAEVLDLYAAKGQLNYFAASETDSQRAAGSAYVAQVRQKLEQSNDLAMILWASNELVGMSYPSKKKFGDVDPLALGKALIERVLQTQPNNAWARQQLNVVADKELMLSLPETVWQGSLESRHSAIAALPEGDRFRELAILAIAAGDAGVRAAVQKHDAATENADWQQAAGYAREALELAPKVRNHPDYGTAFFNANMVMGVAAVHAGDVKSAAGYLLKAADAPATEALQYPIVNARPWAMNWHFPDILTSALLKAGERGAVLDFLERYSKINVEFRQRWMEDMALIRQGKRPAWAKS